MWQPSLHRKTVRHYEDGQARFLTFSCFHGLPLLSKDRSREWFVSALEEAREEHGFHLWAWVIMPEHVHLLIWPPPVRVPLPDQSTHGTMKGILASIKRPVGQKAVAFLRASAPDFLGKLTVRNRNRTYHRFWQAGPGYDENISNAGILREVIDYIHLNPVRRGLVAKPTDWIWSSARDLAGFSHGFLKVDRTIPETYEIPWTGRRSEI